MGRSSQPLTSFEKAAQKAAPFEKDAGAGCAAGSGTAASPFGTTSYLPSPRGGLPSSSKCNTLERELSRLGLEELMAKAPGPVAEVGNKELMAKAPVRLWRK